MSNEMMKYSTIFHENEKEEDDEKEKKKMCKINLPTFVQICDVYIIISCVKY